MLHKTNDKMELVQLTMCNGRPLQSIVRRCQVIKSCLDQADWRRLGRQAVGVEKVRDFF